MIIPNQVNRTVGSRLKRGWGSMSAAAIWPYQVSGPVPASTAI